MEINGDMPDMEFRNRKKAYSLAIPEWIISRSVGEKIEETLNYTYMNAKTQFKGKEIKSAGAKAVLFSLMIASVLVLFSTFNAIFRSPKVPVARHSVRTDWHDMVSSLRQTEVINPRFDDMYISILVGSGEFEMSKDVHSAIGTFLRQVRYLQVANSRVSNTFIAGEPGSVLPFFREVPELPQLERYIDAYETMYETQPNLNWYVQIDDGTLKIIRFLCFPREYQVVFGAVQARRFGIYPQL